jgi:hypothetical protein
MNPAAGLLTDVVLESEQTAKHNNWIILNGQEPASD